MKGFQVLLFYINYPILHYSFDLTLLNGFMYRKWLNISIWSIDGTLTRTTTPGQCGPESNANEGILHIPQISPSDGLVLYLRHSLGVGILPSAEMESAYSTAPADWARSGFLSVGAGVVYRGALRGSHFWLKVFIFQNFLRPTTCVGVVVTSVSGGGVHRLCVGIHILLEGVMNNLLLFYCVLMRSSSLLWIGCNSSFI